MWWGGAVLCMNIIYVLTCHLLQDCDQDTFFLSVLTILCIYQFPEIFTENISKIFLPASCCFVVYKKKKKIKLNTNLNIVLEKQELQLLEWLGFRPRSRVHTCWFTRVPARSWVSDSASAHSVPELPETISSRDKVGSHGPAPHAHIRLVWFSL